VLNRNLWQADDKPYRSNNFLTWETQTIYRHKYTEQHMRRDMQIISNIVTVSNSSLLLFALSRPLELSAAYTYEWLTQYLNQHRSQKRIAYTKYIKVFLATKNSGKIIDLWNQRSTKSVSQNSYRLITHPRVCGLRKWISKPNFDNTIATGNADTLYTA
jgi:hypothetical protein